MPPIDVKWITEQAACPAMQSHMWASTVMKQQKHGFDIPQTCLCVINELPLCSKAEKYKLLFPWL